MTYRENCKYCGEPKVVPAKLQKGVYPKTFLEDPYCSRPCCEADFAEQREKEKAKKAKAKSKAPRTTSGANRKRKAFTHA